MMTIYSSYIFHQKYKHEAFCQVIIINIQIEDYFYFLCIWVYLISVEFLLLRFPI